MALVRRESNPPVRYRDPFAMARDMFAWDLFGDQRPAVNFAPSFEVKETPETYVVKADMPGVKEDNLDVSLHNGILAISGTREAEERKEGETYFLYERQYGAFSRSFSLPDTADAERVEAKLDGGVLTVTIGKRPEAKPKKIALRK
ncbi:MAG: Hsp20/alpha crystallin family protein [Myxococcales bacterium]|nr:Hsp20/alpha crystallin family protein [Myxococcales bacterium]